MRSAACSTVIEQSNSVAGFSHVAERYLGAILDLQQELAGKQLKVLSPKKMPPAPVYTGA